MIPTSLFLLFVASAVVLGEPVDLSIDVPVNGTIGAKTTLQFQLNSTKAQDWQFVSFAFQLDSADHKRGDEVGHVKYYCETNTVESSLLNGIPLARLSPSTHCTDVNHIELSSSSDREMKYWLIVADIDQPMYNLPDNSYFSSAVTGHSQYEYVSFQGFIGDDSIAGGAIDVVNVTIKYDVFSSSSIRAFVSEYPRPVEIRAKHLQNVDHMLVASLDRNDPLFCHNCTRYVHVVVDNAQKAFVDFSIDFHVDRDLVYLEPHKAVTGSVMPDNHGQHFIIDLRYLEYDTDIRIVAQKLDQPDIPVYVDLSLTSFDDGTWDTIKTLTMTGLEAFTWGLERHEAGYKVGTVYYIRVRTEFTTTTACGFTLQFSQEPVPYQYVYTGMKRSMGTSNGDLHITYYAVNIPQEEFIDVTGVVISIQNITYTWNPSPVYCYGFDMYLGDAPSELMINPQDPTSYAFHSWYAYKRQDTIMITENEEGWCTGCRFGIVMRTQNETHWTVTADLMYTPFMLQPNTPKTGRLAPFVGGVHTYFYLYQKEYHPITITVVRASVTDPHVLLYVSTLPDASVTNHMWSDSTLGDNTADVRISRDHPHYCANCRYYIGVYFLNDEKEGIDTSITVSVDCPENSCLVCKDGFDPATDCMQCLPGYYGDNCSKCPDCNHGSCNDGKTGNGKCVCNEGWGPAGECIQCLEGYWGLSCEACPSCHNHGKCDDGFRGTGKCVCDTNFDQRIDCEDCISGYYGEKCSEMCPSSSGAVCSNHGVCYDGILGNGYCKCNEGFVGMKCDTLYSDDRCNPHCVVDQGACDEDKAVCVCFTGYTGNDCSVYGNSSKIMIYMTLLCIVVVLALIVSIVCIVRCPKKPSKKRSPKATDPLLNSP